MKELNEGKIKNLASVLLMISTIARANPMILNIQGTEWRNQNYNQKVEYVKDLYKISTTEKFPAYVSTTDQELINHKLNPKLMCTILDSFYLDEKNREIPVWLAILKLENKITDLQLNTALSNLKARNIFWINSDDSNQ